MRQFCLQCLALLLVVLGPDFALAAGSEPGALALASKERFIAGRPGVRIVAHAFYTRAEGVEMLSAHLEQTQSDKADVATHRFSSDNGRTWGEPQRVETFAPIEGGTRRRGLHPGFVDPATGVMITMINQGTLPSDKPLEGMKHWTLRYALSRDGGRSFYHEEPVVQRGGEFTPEHPLPGVWVGRNSAMIGDTTCVAIRTRSGEILQPVQITPVGPDGEYYNPGGGYTYHDAAVLIGRWNSRGTLDWECSQRVQADPKRSTRGVIEPTIAELPDGSILMVLRGSNDRKPDLPGYRWVARSSDAGRTWSEPRPWTHTDGQAFFSPSSCSQFLRHTSGRIFWIGNISPENPRGNAPRYPLVIGEVDARNGLLARATLCTLEDRREGDADYFAASNFYAFEDRETRQIVVHCSPLGRPAQPAETRPSGRGIDWTADAYVYRVVIR